MKGIIVGPCRSGTTMLYRSLGNHPSVQHYGFQSIKEGQRKNGFPDYSFFEQKESDKLLVTKETVGHSTLEDCTLRVFPQDGFDDIISKVSPLFVFRDPVETFDSWKRNNLVPRVVGSTLFAMAYRWTFELYSKAKDANDNTMITLYEEVCQNPEESLRQICGNLGIPFDDSTLHWDDKFQNSVDLDKEGVDEGHYDRILEAKQIERKQIPCTLSDSEKSELAASGTQEIYEEIKKIIS